MFLTKFIARYFRCITDVEINFPPGLSIVIGANAQGKTSLLEGIYFLSLSRSLRTSNERDLVQYHKEGFILKGEINSNRGIEKITTIETKWQKGNKKILINGIEIEKLSELIGKLRVIFLTSDFSDIVREGAGYRRKFLDIQLSQTDHEYLTALQGYQRALRQRNELLRKNNVSDTELWVWEKQMAEYAIVLIKKRQEFLDNIKPFATYIHSQIVTEEKLEISYEPNIEGENFLRILEETRKTDIQRGQTQRGPHRDDIEIRINGYLVRQYASQGQQKTCAYALRLAEIYLWQERKSDLPIILADELFSELDPERGKKFLEVIPNNVQVIITAVDENVCNNLLKENNKFHIRNGYIEKA